MQMTAVRPFQVLGRSYLQKKGEKENDIKIQAYCGAADPVRAAGGVTEAGKSAGRRRRNNLGAGFAGEYYRIQYCPL